MKKKLYGDEISPKCEYCAVGTPSPLLGEILCEKKGIMSSEDCCKKFKYDPLKRAPKIISLGADFKAEDFSL